MKDKRLQMIGNAHLDPVWLWNWQEGFQEVKATFKSALDRMNEDDEFIFTCSSSLFYEWVENNNKEMFDQIKKRIKEGRWEIVGGWYIQPDCNIPSGESFVRQGLYAQRYFKEKFGKIAKTAYNVDSFGHTATLPQIFKKSGMDNYCFMRPMPNEKRLPKRTFWWESDDGSKVLAYRIPYEYNTWPKSIEKHIDKILSELNTKEDYLMMFYGVGNHGGGPTRENIKSIHELNSREDMPKMKMGTTEEYFENFKKENNNIPVYNGDLQHHASGCYSVNSQIKKQNRLAENILITAEYWSSIANVVERQKYPDDFIIAWKSVLFNQFHDILAGTSIKSAYDDATYQFGQAMAIGQKNLNSAVQSISWDIDIEENIAMKPIVVFNSHPWDTKCIVEIEMRGQSDDDFKILDNNNNEVPSQTMQSEATVNGQQKLVFIADVPSMGYRTYKYFKKPEKKAKFQNVKANKYLLENNKFRLSLDSTTGQISELYDKENKLNILKGNGAVLSVIRDTTDTWGHNQYIFDDEIAQMELLDISISEKGPVRSSIKVKSKYKNSYVVQEIRMYKELDHIEVKCDCIWHEEQTMLKLKYPLALNFRKAIYEIPYGQIEKPANNEEEPGQNWIDLSGEHMDAHIMYGLSVANDSKYSYSFFNNEMSMTILKNSVYAHHTPKVLDKNTEYDYIDDGRQSFTYALLPHAGAVTDTDIIKLGKEINQKCVAIIETFHNGNLPQVNSFVKIKSNSVIISTIKESEDKDGIVIRAYETKKSCAIALLKLPFMDKEIKLSFTPCEIKTIKIPYDLSKSYEEVNMLEL